MKIISELEKIGLELTSEQKEAITKKFSEDVISNFEHEKKVGKAESDRDSWKQRAETAEETLKGFEGKDFEEITKDRDAWKQKFETLEEEQNKAKQAAELEDAINEHVSGLKFKDEYRKRVYIDDLRKEGYQVKEGKLVGASDFQKNYDADAFVDEKQQNLERKKARFTDKTNQHEEGGAPSRDQIMAMRDPVERQKAIKENIELFQKGE